MKNDLPKTEFWHKMARSMSSKLLCLVAQDTYVNKEVTKNILHLLNQLKHLPL